MSTRGIRGVLESPNASVRMFVMERDCVGAYSVTVTVVTTSQVSSAAPYWAAATATREAAMVKKRILNEDS